MLNMYFKPSDTIFVDGKAFKVVHVENSLEIILRKYRWYDAAFYYLRRVWKWMVKP